MRSLRLIKDESGISLIMVMGILAVLSITGATLISYSNSNARSSHYSKNSTTAYDLAEAGVNKALAVLYNQNPLDPNVLPATTDAMQGGTVTWSGSFNQLSSPALWTLTSTATTPNPSGGTDIRRTVTATIPVTVNVTGSLQYSAWNYIYLKNTSSGCDLDLKNSINWSSPLYVTGNLCLETTSSITAGPIIIHGSVHTDTNANIGTSASPINSLTVGAETTLTTYNVTGCQYKNATKHNPCRNGAPTGGQNDGDNIFVQGIAQSRTSAPTYVPFPAPAYAAPVADFVNWYAIASPGPKIGCATSSGVPGNGTGTWSKGFDIDTVKNNNAPTFDLIPSGSSYSCKTAGGELSWNSATSTLTVQGIVYIDGNATLDHNTNVTYTGKGALYLSGTFLLRNAKLCAVYSGSSCNWNTWNPANTMLVVVADGQNGPTPMPSADSVFLRSTNFQGAIYATHTIEFDTTAETQGPMVGPTAINGNQDVTHPFTTPFNVPVGLPGQVVVSPGVLGTPTIIPN